MFKALIFGHQNIAVITLKLKHIGLNIAKCLQKMQMKWQTVQTLIRLLCYGISVQKLEKTVMLLQIKKRRFLMINMEYEEPCKKLCFRLC